MPWLCVVGLGLIGIVIFNYGAFFLCSTRWLGLPLLCLVVAATLMGQGTLAVGLIGGGVLFAGSGLIAIIQWQKSAVVPRRQLWWSVVLGVVAWVVVMLTAINGRVSGLESWALLIVGFVSYWLRPRTGKRLAWWRWLVGLVLCVGGGTLAVWAMPTVGAVCGLSPLVGGTLLAVVGSISTMIGLWRQRPQTPAVVLTQAVGGLFTDLLTMGFGLMGVLSGGWTVGATTLWLTLPCVALMLAVGTLPLLLRQKTTRWGSGLLLLIYAGYWLLLWL